MSAAVRITGGWQADRLSEADVAEGWGQLANMVGGNLEVLLPVR